MPPITSGAPFVQKNKSPLVIFLHKVDIFWCSEEKSNGLRIPYDLLPSEIGCFTITRIPCCARASS